MEKFRGIELKESSYGMKRFIAEEDYVECEFYQLSNGRTTKDYKEAIQDQTALDFKKIYNNNPLYRGAGYGTDKVSLNWFLTWARNNKLLLRSILKALDEE